MPEISRYGFLFWLGWIVQFAGSFILAVIFWTFLMRRFFGTNFTPELTITWSVCVFGSWFICVVPFMRKKEQIWKRLNDDQEKAVDAWLTGLNIFIGLFIASAFFWTWKLKGGALWAKYVFGTWLVFLLPFLIVMYRQADRIFKTAKDRQFPLPASYRKSFLEPSLRVVPSPIKQKLASFRETLPGGHVVRLRLKDGRIVENAFIKNGRELLGLYDQQDLFFDIADIQDVESISADALPVYDESKWLRLDAQKA